MDQKWTKNPKLGTPGRHESDRPRPCRGRRKVTDRLSLFPPWLAIPSELNCKLSFLCLPIEAIGTRKKNKNRRTPKILELRNV